MWYKKLQENLNIGEEKKKKKEERGGKLEGYEKGEQN